MNRPIASQSQGVSKKKERKKERITPILKNPKFSSELLKSWDYWKHYLLVGVLGFKIIRSYQISLLGHRENVVLITGSSGLSVSEFATSCSRVCIFLLLYCRFSMNAVFV